MRLDAYGFGFLRSFFGPQANGNGKQAAQSKPPSSALLEYAQLDASAVLARLETSADGLLAREAAERLQRYGDNSVAHEESKSPLRQLLELFLAPLSLMLLALALVAELTGEVRGAIVISLMVVLSVCLLYTSPSPRDGLLSRMP